MLLAYATALPVFGQKTDSIAFHLSQSLPVAARYAAADQLGNTYIITTENAIEKYAPDGRRLARYTQNRIGQATLLDISNPLKIMVLYADFRTAVFLDRSLTELGMLSWEAAGFPFVRRVAMGSDGNLWLYDEASFQLKKISPAGEPLFESQAMNLLHDGPMPQPSALLESDNQVFMADTAQGVFVFDAFAQFSKPLFFKGISDFSVAGGRLFFLENGFLRVELLGAFRSEKIALPEIAQRTGTRCFFGNRRLLCLVAGSVVVFDL